MTAAKYLTPLQAARQELGWEGSDRAVDERFKRIVFKKERKLGRQIFLRWGNKNSGIRYRITKPLMRKHMAELYDETDRALLHVREQTGKLARDYIALKVELLGRQEALADSDARLNTRLDDIEKRFDALERRLRAPTK